MTTEFALAVHGGAGTLDPAAMSAARAARYHAGLRRALAAGHGILAAGGGAHEVAARLRHGGAPLPIVARAVIAEPGRAGGSGGLVAVGRDGAVALPFNCSGMYRGYVKDDGIVYTAIYHEPYRSA